MNPIKNITGDIQKKRRRGKRGGKRRNRAKHTAASPVLPPRKKNYAFIDSQNVHQGIRHQSWELDWKRFREHLRTELDVAKVLLFIGYVEGNEPLYKELQDAGFELVFKKTVTVEKDGETITKGNVDADLVLHAMIELPHYDGAVIVTGDGDFHSLLQYLDANKKLAGVMVPHGRRASKLLKEFKDKLMTMDGLRAKLEKQAEAVIEQKPEPKPTPKATPRRKGQLHKNRRKPAAKAEPADKPVPHAPHSAARPAPRRKVQAAKHDGLPAVWY
jgi:uncharacterized LabA/DUF88 family protein